MSTRQTTVNAARVINSVDDDAICREASSDDALPCNDDSVSIIVAFAGTVRLARTCNTDKQVFVRLASSDSVSIFAMKPLKAESISLALVCSLNVSVDLRRLSMSCIVSV